MIGQLKITKNQYQEAIVETDSNHVIFNNHKDIHGCFHGDTVALNNDLKIDKVISSNINKLLIPGVLQCSSKYKFGFNKKNMPLYRFVPLDWHYPDFIVASSLKDKDKYILIKFMKWEDKFPQGCVFKVYDKFNNELLAYKWGIHTNILKLQQKFNTDFSPLTYFSKENLKNHTDYRTLDVISIDPLGSLDIDDALSIQKIDDKWLLGIHIADVSFYIKHFDLLNHVNNRISSIYLPDKIINMLPDILANNICSLREGCDRLAVTLWIYIKEGKYEEYRIERTIIRNRKQYEYDDATLIDSNLYKLSKEIAKNIFEMSIEGWDTHKMVEIYMILCNHLIALLLKDNDKMVFRTHEKKLYTMDIKPPKVLENIVKILNANSAIYQTKTDNYYHYGLDIKYYTHFTSPIRRLADLYVHYLLFEEIDLIDCQKINEFNNKIKRMERDITKHKFINYIQQNNGKKIYVYIIGIDRFNLTLYLPKWKMIYQYKFINKLIEYLWKVDEKKNLSIYSHKPSGDIFILELYQKINIKIWSCHNGKDIAIQPSFLM